MGRGEGTIEEKREGEKKRQCRWERQRKGGGGGEREEEKKKRMQGVCFEPLPC